MNEQNYDKQKIRLSTWQTILRQGNHRGGIFAGILICGMTLGVVRVLGQLLNTYLIDHYMAAKQLNGFLPVACMVLALQMLYALLAYGFCLGAGSLETHLTADVRYRAFEKLQTLSASYYDKTSVGFLLSRLTSDVYNTMNTISWCCIDVGFSVMSFVAAVIGMLILNPALAALLLCTVPVLAVISVFFQKKMLGYNRARRRLQSMVTAAFNEGIMGAATTKTLVREAQNEREFCATTRDLSGAAFRAQMVSALYLPVASLLISFATAVLLYRGGYDVLRGFITIGELNFFLNVANMMFEPVRTFAAIFAEFQAAQAAAERVAEILTEPPAIQDAPEVAARYGTVFAAKKEHWEPVAGNITFDHVYFQYGKEPVLEDFCLEVGAGETIALVGETGSGKSTIVNLLCRFYEPQRGRILIDGKDIRTRSQLWLQSSLGYVLQSPHLFSGTIRDNIRYGRLDASEAEIRSAAKLVGADRFIRALDKGYDTEVGEGGNLLSTGQKQLISFARAILANPSIFVLDEATSSIDTEAELQLQTATEAVLASRTSFVVAHRLSTIRNADRILVIDGGKIVEQGSHRELMERKGRYYALYTGRAAEINLERSLQALSRTDL